MSMFGAGLTGVKYEPLWRGFNGSEWGPINQLPDGLRSAYSYHIKDGYVIWVPRGNSVNVHIADIHRRNVGYFDNHPLCRPAYRVVRRFGENGYYLRTPHGSIKKNSYDIQVVRDGRFWQLDDYVELPLGMPITCGDNIYIPSNIDFGYAVRVTSDASAPSYSYVCGSIDGIIYAGHIQSGRIHARDLRMADPYMIVGDNRFLSSKTSFLGGLSCGLIINLCESDNLLELIDIRSPSQSYNLPMPSETGSRYSYTFTI
jgi:hypothetical protein